MSGFDVEELDRDDLVALLEARIEYQRANLDFQRKVVAAETECMRALQRMVAALETQRDVVRGAGEFDPDPILNAHRDLRVRNGLVPMDCREWVRRQDGVKWNPKKKRRTDGRP